MAVPMDADLQNVSAFNWILLAWLITCGVLSIGFLFYFNRVFAVFVSYLARLYLRWINDPHYFDIESIQISLLAGRVFFGKITYHGPNETITVLSSQITWRYWLRRVRHVTGEPPRGGDREPAKEAEKEAALPCRILVELKGVEWMAYNRSFAYDGIIDKFTETAAKEKKPPGYGEEKEEEDGTQTPRKIYTTSPARSVLRRKFTEPEDSFKTLVDGSWFLNMLPVQLECNRGAIVIGNECTSSVLIARFDRASGIVGARRPNCALDQYQQVYDLDFVHPTVQLKSNPDFKDSLLVRGGRLGDKAEEKRQSDSEPASRRRKIANFLSASMRSSAPHDKNDGVSNDDDLSNRRWVGLQRYLRHSDNEQGCKSEPAEYAKDSDVLDCSKLTVSYYYDILDPDVYNQNGSIEPSPEYGFELLLHDANVHYGPWADRQRVELQAMFFPRLFTPPEDLERYFAGPNRVYTDLKAYIELTGSTILRVPIRESSKDWKYPRRLEEGETRPYGWLDIKIGNESSVSYKMGLQPSPAGWDSKMDVELRKPEVSTSVNNKLLLSAESLSLECDLSGPLLWDADTRWIFNNETDGLQLFILREHVTLITDLVSDWTSGPETEYALFVPMIYQLNLVLRDTEFLFNVNDQNVINDANSFEENTFVVLKGIGGDGGHIRAAVDMDFREFKAQSSTVNFLLETVDVEPRGGALEVAVKTPSWNTWHTSLQPQQCLGTVEVVKVSGSYEFFAEVSPEAIDTLNLDIDGEHLRLTLHGVLLRYFLIIQENYFGENIHFRTLEEWKTTAPPTTAESAVEALSRPKANDLDVVLGVNARDLTVFIPRYLHDSKEYLRLTSPFLGIDMRFTNYYMDLQVDLAPLSAYPTNPMTSLPDLFVNGITIYGHRMFGLPPAEPTYVCNWDIDIGAITGECSMPFIQTLAFAFQSLVFSFKDAENALPVLSVEVIHDVTLLRLRVESLRLWLHLCDTNVVRLTADQVNVHLNDLADEVHSQRINITMPGLSIAFLDYQLPAIQGTQGYFETNLKLSNFERKAGAEQQRMLQQRHLRRSDHRTKRAEFLIADVGDRGSMRMQREPEPTSLGLPGLPPPRYGDGYSNYATDSDNYSRTTRSSGRASTRSFMVHSSRRPSTKSGGSSSASFHSAFESVSDLRTATATPSLHTPVSATPSHGSRDRRRSSLHNPMFKMTPRPLDVELNSGFSRPKYPLDEVSPDLSRVPTYDDDEVTEESRGQSGMAEAFKMFSDPDAASDSFVLELSEGLRGFLTPQAIDAVATAMIHLQPQSPDEILDYIQREVVTELKKLLTKPKLHMPTMIAELCVWIPQIKIALVNESPEIRARGPAFHDSIYINASHLVFSGREKTLAQPAPDLHHRNYREKDTKILSGHLSIRHLKLGLEDLTQPAYHVHAPIPAFNLIIEDILCWGSTADYSTASIQASLFRIGVQSTEALFAYDACTRLLSIGEPILTKLSAISETEEARVQHLVFSLADAGERLRITHDPATLTRPSYVLRSSPEHVRLNDSWKICTRLRHVWQCLREETRAEWTLNSRANIAFTPTGSLETFIAILERWRGWEMGTLADSVIVKQILGGRQGTTTSDGMAGGFLNARVAVDGFVVLIDPGVAQQEFKVDQLLAYVASGGGAEEGSQVSVVESPGEAVDLVVQLNTKAVMLGVKWEALQLFESLSEGLRERQQRQPANSHVNAAVATVNKPKSSGVQIVFSTDQSTIALDTVNLRVVSTSQNFKTSVILSQKDFGFQKSKLGSIASVFINADNCSTELFSGKKSLGTITNAFPSICGYFDEHSFAETKIQIFKIALDCETFHFDVREQVLGLLEVAEFVVNDEVAQVYRMVQKMERQQIDHPESSTAVSARRAVQMINCTLTVENFTLSVALLPSLAYFIRCEGMHFSVKPGAGDAEEVVIRCDVEHHEHEVRTIRGSEKRSISLLKMPPVSINVCYLQTDTETLVEGSVDVQTIMLEASSIQSLLNALNKPEISKLVENAREESQLVTSRIDEVFEVNEDSKAPLRSPKRQLVYHGVVRVAGLKVQTSAPSANLEVMLGIMELRFTNKPHKDVPVLAVPEIRLEFGKAAIELTRLGDDNTKELCGYLELHASLYAGSHSTEQGTMRTFDIKSHSLIIGLYASTASTVVDVIGHLQDKLRDLDLSREVKYLKGLRKPRRISKRASSSMSGQTSSPLYNIAIVANLEGIKCSWIVGDAPVPISNQYPRHDLVLSFKRIHFETMTRTDSTAELIIEEFLLQLVDPGLNPPVKRAENSALLPKVVFNVAYRINDNERRLAFQAKGETLDLWATSSCVLVANAVESSISTAVQMFRDASESWNSTLTESGIERKSMFGSKRLVSVLIDGDFEGAVVHLSETKKAQEMPKTQQTRYEKFTQREPAKNPNTVLKSPGLAFKIEYLDPAEGDPSLNAEVKVSASNNTLHSSVVPLIREITTNIQQVMEQEPERDVVEKIEKAVKAGESMAQAVSDPADILGRCRLNIGFQICKQEFTLSLQPLHMVAASASFEEIYVTVNTCEEPETGRFYAVSGAVSRMRASLQHIYSQKSAGHVEIEKVVVSLMNSKHVVGSQGLSCILNFSPIKARVNGKQMSDFLLFKALWTPDPTEERKPPAVTSEGPSQLLVERYHQVASTKAFPSNTMMVISEVDLQIDLGQSIGKTSLGISNLWVSSQKTSDWEQALCMGFDSIRVESKGVIGGFINLKNMKLRSSINWDSKEGSNISTPLVESSIGFQQLESHMFFDYEPFLLADIIGFAFVMNNQPEKSPGSKNSDRLVAHLDGEKIQIFVTTKSASCGLAVFQRFQKLAQETQATYELALHEALRSKARWQGIPEDALLSPETPKAVARKNKLPQPEDKARILSLHTDVVVHLREIHIGSFPNKFENDKVFKVEARDARAGFEAEREGEKIRSKLEMKLGHLSVALSDIRRRNWIGKETIELDMVLAAATGAKGGIILKVPQVTASMDTWHVPGTTAVDYIFKSAFEGQVDVGWDFGRVTYIKDMWQTHVKAIEQRQGKIVGPTGFTLNTGVESSTPPLESTDGSPKPKRPKDTKRKITAVVNVPQSKYEYTAVEPPVIQTPQLRDMGEATPPLEWIGLHRDRLPNLTHQIMIVSLLEVARKVEGSYSRILGTTT